MHYLLIAALASLPALKSDVYPEPVSQSQAERQAQHDELQKLSHLAGRVQRAGRLHAISVDRGMGYQFCQQLAQRTHQAHADLAMRYVPHLLWLPLSPG